MNIDHSTNKDIRFWDFNKVKDELKLVDRVLTETGKDNMILLPLNASWLLDNYKKVLQMEIDRRNKIKFEYRCSIKDKELVAKSFDEAFSKIKCKNCGFYGDKEHFCCTGPTIQKQVIAE
jgi:DNA-directed RNA polymerase subunit RPC12/RpoP